ncbi:MAG TPA: VOC family protein [Pseudomonadales bacterium]|jgi:catechol 2,3-dioxygenase-like lactoylglutathione lyase family enzyme
MTLSLLSPAVEIGIVTNNPDAMLGFYRDTLGLPYQEKMDFPGGYMHRLALGSNVLKLVVMKNAPQQKNPGGGHGAATGYRYASVGVNNLKETIAMIEQAGHPVPVPATEIFEGFGFAFAEDPDGNWFEFYGPM